MDRKKMIYIGSLLIITAIISIASFSYAIWSNKSEQRGKLNIVAGSLNYQLISDDLNNNSITVPANTNKTIEIEIKSLNTIESKYELYYQTTNENINIGYSEETVDQPTGTISSRSSKKVTVIIKNRTDSSATITFGTQGGFSGKELVLAEGNSLSQISACSVGDVWDFPYNGTTGADGSEQIFDVNCDGYYRIEVWGAQGGSTCSAGSKTGGYGGYAAGDIELDDNDILYIYVGGQPSNNQGYNGGGASSRYQYEDGGGGSTDIRYGGNSLLDRIMVAGAGGGCGGYGSGSPRAGDAGGLNSYRGTTNNSGNACYYTFESTQTSGGYPCNSTYPAESVGTFGQGGSSETGGGSGYYGGGGGYNMSPAGSGGSSFVSGHLGCDAISSTSTLNNIIHTNQPNHFSDKVFSNTTIVDGQGYKWTNTKGSYTGQIQPDGTTVAGHTGNGYARITYLGDTLPIGTTWNYTYQNRIEEFTAPENGTYKLEVWGAQGGSYNTSYRGGYGGYSYGNVELTKGEVLNVVVGSQPPSNTVNGANSGTTCGTNGGCAAIAGGYNGGGNGYHRRDCIFEGGGGATHIAKKGDGSYDILSSYTNSTTASNYLLLVAGGGGGGAYYSSARYGIGGDGGSATGGNGRYGTASNCESYGYGGSQTSGGNYYILSGHYYQSLGISIPAAGFGYGGAADAGIGGSGGGGGYYGGRGTSCLGGGGGGSGFVNTSLLVDSTYATEYSTHEGNGASKITYLGD